jgi:hypothetical protein
VDPRIPEPPGSPRLFRPRSVGEILLHAFAIYRQHWQNLITTVALVVIPLSVVQVLLVDVLIGDTFVEERLREGSVPDATLFGSLLAALAVGVLSVLTWAVLAGAITRAAAGTFLGRDIDSSTSFRYGLSRLGSILLVGLLAGLAVAGGFILLVIPGLFFLTRLTCSLPALVIEDRRGSSALSRSWNLVAGHGWPVFGTIIVAGILTGLVSSLFTAPFGDNTLARLLGQCLAGVITTPYSALVGILIYLDLRIRREHYGPAELAADLDRPAAP